MKQNLKTNGMTKPECLVHKGTKFTEHSTGIVSCMCGKTTTAQYVCDKAPEQVEQHQYCVTHCFSCNQHGQITAWLPAEE